jgi:hypothetical protein
MINFNARQQLLKDYLNEIYVSNTIDQVLLSMSHAKSDHVAATCQSYDILNYVENQILSVDGQRVI